jgi:chromosome partitioning protein
MALDALGLVLLARMHEQVIYAESFAHGKTAFEMDPQGVAANELSAIWAGVKGRITEKKKAKKGEREKVA